MHTRYSYISLVSFLLFILTFGVLQLFGGQAPQTIQAGYPLCAALLALCLAWLSFPSHTSAEDRMAVFFRGAGASIVIHMCFIFFLSTVFSHTLHTTGSLDALTMVCMKIIPTHFMLPGIMAITSLFSFMIGSSMGAIATCMPFALPLGQQLGIQASLTTATVICGAMFGDNLSIISDTTIAAVQVTKSSMLQKLKTNAALALPAFFISLVALSMHHTATITHNLQAMASTDFILLIPFVMTVTLALAGIDILLVLLASCISSCILGIWFGSIDMFAACGIWFTSLQANPDIIAIILLVMLLGALAKTMQQNKGMELLTSWAKNLSWLSPAGIIVTLVSTINAALSINTISIIIAGPIAKNIGKTASIKPHHTATLLDIGACITQGVLPYTPQLLLAASLANISPFHVLPYLYYQYVLLICLLFWILTLNKKQLPL